ncbi:hairy-related 12 [Trichomycterus rosablanca]|uniref:hairy-related 12 n=1 Tax=Trichomycterus rosablanca TaxID=2290929 RepID=UPI002F35FBBF
MVTHSTILSTFDHQRFNEKDRLKLRKPLVEKMRRDRINNCIDQLKKLLEKELHKQDPNSKLEKADILEMTVSFLKEQQKIPTVQAQRDYNQGYSHCWRESLNFLNFQSGGERSAQEIQQVNLDQKFSPKICSGSSVPSGKQSHSDQQQPNRPVWRPW